MSQRHAAMRPLNSFRSLAVAMALVVMFASHFGDDDAMADSITLIGSVIPLRDCEIEDFRSGRLYYRDLRGRRQWRELEEVVAVGFDELPQLDEAERLLREGEADAGLAKLLQALLAADDVKHELWVRVRLIRAHEDRGEFMQSVGHLARVFQLRDETYWRIMEPIVEPAAASYPATLETLSMLRVSQRTVRNHDLRAVVERLLQVIQPLHDRAAAAYTGPPVVAGDTRSGFTLKQIRSGALGSGDAAAPVNSPATPPAGRPAATPNRIEPTTPGTRAQPRGQTLGTRNGSESGNTTTVPDTPDSRTQPASGLPRTETPEAIDRLIDTGRADEAVKLCDQIARRPGDRSLSRFLYQYGRALAGAGRPEDAAIMYMRCAVLFETSAFAARSLLDSAQIHREQYRDERAARRLILRAIELAEKAGASQAEVVERARAMLAAASAKKTEQ